MRTATEYPNIKRTQNLYRPLNTTDVPGGIQVKFAAWELLRIEFDYSFQLDKYILFQETSPQRTYAMPCRRFLSKLKYGQYELQIESGLSLEIALEYKAPHFIAYNEKFGIYGSGETEESAINDFEQSFIEFYLMLTDCPEDNLAESTLAFRKTLQSFAVLIVNE